MRKLWFVLAMLVCIFAGCSDGGNEGLEPTPKPDVVTPEITIDSSIMTNGLSFDTAGGDKSVSFSTNVNWTLNVASTTGGTTWCQASATSGTKGAATIKFTVAENTSYDDRSVSVTIKAGTVSKTFTIIQKGVDALLVTTNKYELSQEGGKIEVEVKANIEYQMEISETAKSWITEASSRALTAHKHSLNIATNEEVEKREGEIYFKSGDKVETVKVYQAGGAILLLSQNEYTVSDAGEMITVDIKSNIEFGVQLPDVDWITDEASSRGMSSHTLNYYIAPNEGYDSRSAEIIFFDKNSDLQDTLKVIQAQKDAIVISQKTYDVKAEGETIEVKLSSNVEFEVTMPDVDWIEQVSSRALKEHTLYFKVAENEGEDSRSAEIVFVNKESELSETITISQDCKSLLAIAQDEYNVDDAGETISVAIRNNVEYAIQMPDVDWITEATASRSVSTDTLKFVIAANEEYDSRFAEIIFFDKNSDLKDTLKVTQAQKDAIVISQKTFDIKAEGETIEVKLSANVDFEITMPDVDWVKQVSSRALKEYTLYFEVAENTGDESRSANITITNKDSQLSETIVVTQQGDITVVTLKEAGTLKSLLGNDYLNINLLKIVGPINGDDVYYLRKMLGGKNFSEADWGRLTELDLSEALIVEGGEYYNVYDDEKLYTSNNVIGTYMFEKCANLQEIALPENATSIGADAFSGCSALTNVSIGSSVTSIGDSAFKGCSSLTSVVIPDGVTSIGDSAFRGCSSLTSVVIPDGVTLIGGCAFDGCSALASVVIPDGVTLIGNYAFQYCSALASIVIPDGVTSIGDAAFRWCSSLTSVVVPDGITWIRDYAFYGCSALTSVVIPDGVTSIGRSAFYGCSITKFYSYPTTPPSFYSYSFYDGVESDATLYVPARCGTVYKSSGWVVHFKNIVEMD